MTSLETARSLANGPIEAGGLGWISRELQRLLSLIGYGSTGGVCGRSLMDGKILFTGSQTCSLYLVLWLCGTESGFHFESGTVANHFVRYFEFLTNTFKKRSSFQWESFIRQLHSDPSWNFLVKICSSQLYIFLSFPYWIQTQKK